MLKVLTLV